MAKFTNRQLDVLGEAILDKLEQEYNKAKEQIINSDEYKNYKEELEKSDIVNRLRSHSQSYIGLLGDVRLLNTLYKNIEEELSENIETVKKYHNGYYSSTRYLKGFGTSIELRNSSNPFRDMEECYIKKMLEKKFSYLDFDKQKMKKKVEAQILLGEAKDAKQVINTISEKLSPNAESDI